MSAEIPRALLDEKPEEAVRRMNWYYDVFGPDRFFVELQQHDIKEITDLNRRLVEMGARYSAQIHRHQRRALHQPGGCPPAGYPAGHPDQHACSDDPDRMRMTDDSYYLRSPEEMSQLFRRSARSAEQHAADRRTLQCGPVASRAITCRNSPSRKAIRPRPTCGTCARRAARRYGDRARSPEVRETTRLRAGRHPQDGIRRLLPDRLGPVPLRPRERHLVQRARLGGRFHRRLRAGDHAGRSAPARSALRTLPEPGPHLDARYRPGFPG